jgi:hypothetical protein
MPPFFGNYTLPKRRVPPLIPVVWRVCFHKIMTISEHQNPESLTDQIRAYLQAVTGPDAKGNYQALCPFHSDRHPSLSLHPQRGWQCFAGCGEGKLTDLASRLGIVLPEGGSAKQANTNRQQIVATYDYRNKTGQLLFQVVRFAPKGFAQRRPDGSGGWVWNLNGIRRVL